ncbi:MAG: class I SAM-dependent methyltransferase [Phycisphaerales bacterium]|nr:MAG: class I SAM-dependent methyltransferase [Phycisphaerales bacterium]
MKDRFKRETQLLERSWSRHDSSTLRDYLVRDVEDPRINVQSILTRHFLIERLFGNGFDYLAEHEMRFALVVNWLLRLLKRSVAAWQLQAVLDALLTGRDDAEGLQIPSFVSETFAGLMLPNYICDLLNWAPVETTEAPIPEYLMSTFERIWSEVLEDEQHQSISILEPACGSANDYRFIESFGIARLIDYTGFDLCEKNVHNARHICPCGRFAVGNVLEIDADDDAFEFCFVHDLFEHLSIEAMEAAIKELCRVTRRDICVGFFNMQSGGEHVVRPVGHYHWNYLSLPRTKAIFERCACRVRIIHINEYLTSSFGCTDTHNKSAYTFIISL